MTPVTTLSKPIPIARRNRAILLAIFLLLIPYLAGCTHTIGHATAPPTTSGGSGEIVLAISPETANRTVDKRIGINVDTWRFEVGNALTDILPSALAARYEKVSLVSGPQGAFTTGKPIAPTLSIRFVDLDFNAGLTVFSEHSVTVTVHAEFKDADGKTKFAREFRSQGSSSGSSQGKTWGGLVFAPLATEGMNNATEVAVTNSIIQLAGDILQSIDQR